MGAKNSKTWLVEHIGNDEEKVTAWWENLQKTMKAGEMEKAQAAMQTKSYVGHCFMPTTCSSKIFCLWETRTTMDKEQSVRKALQNHLGKKVTVGAYTDNCHCILNPLAISPAIKTDVDPTKIFGNSKFFMIQHVGLNQNTVLKWHADLQENFTEKGMEKVFGEMRADQLKNDVYNHFYMQTSNNNSMFCLWEVKNTRLGNEETVLLNYIEKSITGEAFYNIAHQINLEATDLWKILPENKTKF